MTVRRFIILVGLILGLCAATSFGADAGRESPFSLGSGTRSLGMGGGFVGLANDASAIYWNQAALASLDYQQVDLMHVTLFEGTIYDAASYVYPHEKWGGFGLSFMRVGTSSIPIIENYVETGRMSYSMGQFLLGYGRRLEGGFSIGAALKLVNQSMGDNSTYGTGIDLSFMMKATDNISAGVIFQDLIAPRLRLGGNLEVVPMNVLAGASWKNISLHRDFTHNVNLAFEQPEFRSTKIHIGVESIYKGYLALRIGLDRDNMTFGMGINYDRLRFDYAYRFINDITDSHRFGLTINIGKSIPDKIREASELESARGSYLVLDDRKRQFDFYKGVADGFYEYNELDSALVYYQRALAFNESDSDALNRIEQIRATQKKQLDAEQAERGREERRESRIDGYYSQAAALYEKGDYNAALGAIDLAHKEAPEDPRFMQLRERVLGDRKAKIDSLMTAAGALEIDGRQLDALEIYYRVVELDSENRTAAVAITRIDRSLNVARLIKEGVEYFTNKNYSEANQRFEQVLRLEPNNSVATDYRSRISVLMKKVTDLEDLEKDERVWRIYLNALEHFRNGEYENAIRLWEEVLQFYPGNISTINNIEQARLRMKSETQP
jgi:tetratricopeptide (TPR) repeat protein